MKWIEVRQHFPNRCVLVEALKAETINQKRIIEEMAVISDYETGNDAWKAYKLIHADDHSRELYIFHTKNEETVVIEQPYVGVRRKI
jgi:hypothetical protein